MIYAEQKIQTAIVIELRRRFDCFVTAVPNGGARTALEAMAFRDAGLTAGAPDLVVCGPGARVVFLEVKARVQVRERGTPPLARIATLDPAQQRVVGRLRHFDLPVAVVDSVSDAVAILDGYGFPPKGAAPARSAQALATGF